MNIELLTWDSHFFNCKVGRVILPSINELLYKQLLVEKKQFKFDKIYLILENELDKTMQIDLVLMDAKIVYSKTLKESINNDASLMNAYAGKLTPALLNLVYASGHKSRFYKDVQLTKKFKDLYKTWILKSLNNEMADVVFVVGSAIDPHGFVTIKKNKIGSQIGLIAVDEQYKGKGIGKKLLDQVELWSLQKGLTVIDVATQRENIQACRFYEKNNFQINSVKYIYHI